MIMTPISCRSRRCSTICGRISVPATEIQRSRVKAERTQDTELPIALDVVHLDVRVIFATNDGYVESDQSHFWGNYIP
jgi:hypothetical protein